MNHYFAAIFADWTGYNVSLLDVNNRDREGVIRLLSSSNSDMVSNDNIIESIKTQCKNIGSECFIEAIVTNKNDSLYKSLKAVHRQCSIQYVEINNTELLLYELADKMVSGKLQVAENLVKNIKHELGRSTADDIPHRMSSLIRVVERWGSYSNIGRQNTNQRRIPGLVY